MMTHGRGGTEAFHFPQVGLYRVAFNEREIEVATRLVEDLTGDPSKYRDAYRADLLARVKAKVNTDPALS